MAIYHCSVKPISRGSGKSIVAAAAYRHGCRMEDKRTGEVHDYSRKRGVEASDIYLPSGDSPSWAKDRSQLWNAAEAAETRKNSRLGREIVLALPDELSAEQRRELAGEMASHIVERYEVAVDVAIHQPNPKGDDRNFHVHMLVSARRLTSNGFGEKTRELDDREQGPAEVEHLRAEWARLANRALEQAGQHVQIDHRSFQRQGVKRMPSLHLGPSASALERRGVQTRLGDRNRAAHRLNEQAATLELMQRELENEHQAVVEERELRDLVDGIRDGAASLWVQMKEGLKDQEDAERQTALAAERAKQEEQRRLEAERQLERERKARELAKLREQYRQRDDGWER